MFKFTCGGKVFITGEYSCIEGGPALLTTVGPSFTLIVEEKSEGTAASMPFADASPAGIYLNSNRAALEGTRLTWKDPYDTPIGVGSSSAQFLLSVAVVAHLMDRPLPKADEVLDLYWKTVGASQGLRPSGVDVVAQWLGGPIVVRNAPFQAHKLSPWREADDAVFALAFTGKKARTHEHLQMLHAHGFPDAFASAFTELNAVTSRSIEAWEKQDAHLLGRSLTEYQRALAKHGLAPSDFTGELEKVASLSGVLGCKGSGAQGGDCVLLLIDRAAYGEVAESMRGRGWQPLLMNLSCGGVRSIRSTASSP